MFKFILIFTLLALTSAASVSQQKEDDKYGIILRQGEEKTDDGSFAYYYESSDGSRRQEVGIVKNSGTENESLTVKGSYSYFDRDHNEVVVEYIADENGFQPQGTHISPVISQAAHEAAVRSRQNDTKS